MTTTTLIENLQNPFIYHHPVKYFKLIETHISWVILTGDYVYKIKKPLDLEFLDFSSLEKRHHFCHEELRLNKPLAPEIYLDVVSISGSPELPTIGGSGPAIEYAVRMREFEQTALFDYLLENDKLTQQLINKAAEKLAAFHLRTATCSITEPYGTPQQVHEPVKQNFDQIRPMLDDKQDLENLANVEAWANQQHEELHHILQERKRDGYIRECHGDVHLGNIALIKDEPVIFDCIEFNNSFRWTDVMADPGFLAMDLEDHHKPDYAHRLINQYLQHTGDYLSLHVLNYYKSYRAMVRAKVALFNRLQASGEEDKNQFLEKYRGCIKLAHNYIQPDIPCLIITHGLSASGKSTIAEQLVDSMGCIQISSDIERKRLAGISMTANTDSGVCEGLYDPMMTDKTYAKLLAHAEIGLNASKTILIDASFLKQQYRQQFSNLALQMNVPFIILDCQAPIELLREWLNNRQKQLDQVSEAYQEVLTMQSETQEMLTPEEKLNKITINLETFKNISEILPIIREKMKL